jgi:anti-sigma B factor antagonist
MKHSIETLGGIEVLKLHGEIDLKVSPDLRGLLTKKAQAPQDYFIFDLQDVSYIDSSGLATFVEFFQLTREKNSNILMAGLKPRVRSIFELVRLEELFIFCDCVADAIEKVGGAPGSVLNSMDSAGD